MNPKFIAGLVFAGLLLLGSLLFLNGAVGHNDDQNWQVHQSMGGTVTIIDEPGYYFNGFGTVWTYPRTLEAEYTQDITRLSPLDDSIGVTFNDGGNAKISTYVKIGMPTTAAQRRSVHRDFAGTKNIVDSAKGHLTNCIKASGPVMSASENQASRKAEFNQIIEEQLGRGLFKMRRTEIELNDLAEVEEHGDGKLTEKKARVMATEVVLGQDGKPIVIQPSPLAHYGFGILQFSIVETEYDEQTRHQFAAKKESYLKAEQAKAQRQEEVQQRLRIEEMGRRQVAEIEAEQNQVKTRALIVAQQAADVAVITKAQAVTEALKKSEVAKQLQSEAQTLKETARISAETAELEKQATVSRAQARQKELELGGGISEEKKVLAQIAADRDVKVAEALSKVNVPQVFIAGGNQPGKAEAGGQALTENLMNLMLLKSTGVIK